MFPRLLSATALIALPFLLCAQWVQGGMFSVFNHFQACAFHHPDSGLFVYGSDNPVSGEGGVIATYDGLQGGGFYLWYESPLILEDIDVKVSDGFPIYLAAGSQSGGISVILRPYETFQNPFFLDSVRTGFSQAYRAVRMRSDLVAFAGGVDFQGNGVIDMSVDTGATWSQVAMLPGQPVSRLDVVTDQLLFAATGGYRRTINNGVQLPDSGAIYRSPDGGMTWTQVHADPANGFSDVSFANANNGAATRNDGAILYTNDGGSTWTPATIQFTGPFILTAMEHRPDGTAFAAGYRTDGSEGFILISADGGMTWDLNYSTAGLNNSRRIYGLFFHDNITGYAATHIKPHKTSGLITGLTERGSEDLMLFPNPSDHSSTLRFGDTSPRTVEVYDPLGRVVYRSRTNSASLELSKPGPAGSYLVRVVSTDGVRTGRWLVQ